VLRTQESSIVQQLSRCPKNRIQDDLGAGCGLDRSYVSGLEGGRRSPTYLNLLRIAKTFGMPLVALLDLDRPREAR
jgi:transcriptional regulator with XRE-family HTH domain